MKRAVKRASMAAACAALLSPLASCDAPTMPGHGLSDVYDFRLLTEPRLVLRWPTGTTVRVYVAGGSGERASLLEAATDEGARVWNEEALYGEYLLVRTGDITEADAVIRWSDDLPPVDTEACQPLIVRAVTTFCLTDPDPARARLQVFPLLPPHQAAQSNVRMLVTILGTQSLQPERVHRLVAHELGHVLGIGQHSLDARDLMYGGEPGRADPSQRDAATMRVMYHTRPHLTP
ncbi:hypothetical protein BH23GEM9_BH23GEM9_02260 [soil metagenome]